MSASSFFMRAAEHRVDLLQRDAGHDRESARDRVAREMGFTGWDDLVLANRCQHSCPSCGELFDNEEELEKHDWHRCWNQKRACPKCDGKHGYDWDSDPHHKICLGCGFKWDKV